MSKLEKKLEKMVSEAVFSGAQDLYREGNGNFTALFSDGKVLKVEADYEEGRIFKTSLTVDQENGDFIESECDCPVAKKNNGMCKHVVSLGILSDNTEKVSKLIGSDDFEMLFEDDFEKREIVKINKRLERIEKSREIKAKEKKDKEQREKEKLENKKLENEKREKERLEINDEILSKQKNIENDEIEDDDINIDENEKLEIEEIIKGKLFKDNMLYEEEKAIEIETFIKKINEFNEESKNKKLVETKKELKLEIEIDEESYSDYRYGYDYEANKKDLGYVLRIKSGIDKTYYIKDIVKFVNSVLLGENYEITSKINYNPEEYFFSEMDENIIVEISKYYTEASSIVDSGIKDKKGLKLNSMLSNRILEKMGKGKKIIIMGEEVQIMNNYEPLFILDKNKIIFREIEKISEESPFFKFKDDKTKIYKMKENENLFLRKFGDLNVNFLNNLPDDTNKQLKKLVQERKLKVAEYIDEMSEIGIYVQEGENKTNVKITLSNSIQSIKKGEKYFIPKRNIILINELEEILRNLSVINIENIEEIKSFVLDYDGFSKFSELVDYKYKDKVQIYLDNTIKKARSISVSIDVKKNKGELLSVNFNIDGIEPEEVELVIEAIRNEKKYVTLSTGELVKIANKSIEELLGIVDSIGNIKMGENKISKVKALQLAQISGTIRDGLTEIDEFKNLFQKIKEKKEFDPTNIKVTLFPYQKLGFNWLKNMYDIGFGAILADDMGLGKTLQTISLLNEIWQENKNFLALIIVPTSLLHNWKEEIMKFSSMKPILVEGNSKFRKDIIDATKKGLLITTYQALRNDIEEYQNKKFDILILDEAQNIKTTTSQIKKAVMKLDSKVNFALTGTPVENNVLELWSIFDFVLPGYLDNLAKFKKNYKEVLVNPNSKKIENLKSIINPFLLRRTKKEVLTELPEKIETNVVVQLNSEQKQLYLSYVKQAKKEISKFNKSENNRMKILAILTKLRQICNSPKLFKDDYNGEIAKIEVLRDLMPDIVENGHRVLIFSQFVGTLKEIENELKHQGIEYFYIDGSVKSEERMEICKRFNAGESQAVLISLKAGGTGLNLVGADVVIHYDPWWNIAVENQASDRAYRIGQKNSVQVIKLVTEGTIEEKIIKIQENKRVLSDNLLEGNEGEKVLFDMSDDELMDLLI